MFVHFPIALLTIYGFLEILSVHRLFNSPKWVHVKAVLVIIGAAAAFITLQTGEIAAENNFGGEHANALVSMHSTWANMATIIFSVMAVAYAFSIIKELSVTNKYYLRIPIGLRNFLDKILNILINSPIRFAIVIFGIIAITITGGLGGAIVYGPDVDPVVSFIYGLFFKK